MRFVEVHCVCGALLFERLKGDALRSNEGTRIKCRQCKQRVLVRDSDLSVVRVDKAPKRVAA